MIPVASQSNPNRPACTTNMHIPLATTPTHLFHHNRKDQPIAISLPDNNKLSVRFSDLTPGTPTTSQTARAQTTLSLRDLLTILDLVPIGHHRTQQIMENDNNSNLRQRFQCTTIIAIRAHPSDPQTIPLQKEAVTPIPAPTPPLLLTLRTLQRMLLSATTADAPATARVNVQIPPVRLKLIEDNAHQATMKTLHHAIHHHIEHTMSQTPASHHQNTSEGA